MPRGDELLGGTIAGVVTQSREGIISNQKRKGVPCFRKEDHNKEPPKKDALECRRGLSMLRTMGKEESALDRERGEGGRENEPGRSDSSLSPRMGDLGSLPSN